MSRGRWALLAAGAGWWLAGGGPAALPAQEVRGWLMAEAEPGYMTNGFLDPAFAAWTPEVAAAYGGFGGSAGLEWSGPSTTATLQGAARWLAFEDDSLGTWSSYLGRTAVRQRLGGGVDVGLEGALSEIREPADRRTLWGRTTLRWAASPRVRISAGPGVAHRRFPGVAPLPAGGGGPPIPGVDPPVEEGSGESTTATATTYLAGVELEAWTGGPWRMKAEAHGGHTESPDLDLEYRGAGGSLRLTRWVGRGGTLSVGAGLDAFGYQAAADAGAEAPEVPEDDLLWHGELAAGWPLGRRAELRGRLAGVGGAAGSDGADVLAALGLRLRVGGRLDRPRRPPALWTRAEEGLRLDVRVDGPGRLYVTGDFNAWADPGVELRPQGGGLHAVTLRLEPGRYEYRIRVVEDGRRRWLELPETVPTVDDGFGGRNGLLVVPAGDGGTRRSEDER